MAYHGQPFYSGTSIVNTQWWLNVIENRYLQLILIDNS